MTTAVLEAPVNTHPDFGPDGQIILGASEVPALFCPYWYGQGDLWAFKTRKAERPPPEPWQRLGLLLEPAIYGLLEEEGITGERQTQLIYGNLRATPDLIEPSAEPRDIKTVGMLGPIADWNQWEGEYPPEYVTLQVTVQMMAIRRARGVNVERGHVSALLRRGTLRLAHYSIPFVQRLADEIDRRVDQFILCCQRDTPPALPSLSVARLMKRKEGKRTPIAAELCERLHAATEARKQIEKDEAEIKAAIEGQLAIVGADTGDCPGWVVTSDERHRKEFVSKATTYRQLTVKPEKKRAHEREV